MNWNKLDHAIFASNLELAPPTAFYCSSGLGIVLIFFLLLGCSTNTPTSVGTTDQPIEWKEYTVEARAAAIANGKPVVVWLRPEFNFDAKLKSSQLETMHVKIAIRKADAVTLAIDFHERIPAVSDLIQELGAHPFESSVGIFLANGDVHNVTRGNIGDNILQVFQENTESQFYLEYVVAMFIGLICFCWVTIRVFRRVNHERKFTRHE